MNEDGYRTSEVRGRALTDALPSPLCVFSAHDVTPLVCYDAALQAHRQERRQSRQ